MTRQIPSRTANNQSPSFFWTITATNDSRLHLLLSLLLLALPCCPLQIWWLFKARCLRPTEGAKRGLGGPNDCLSITDLSSQPPESSGLSTQSHRLSLGFRADPRVNINFLMHFLSLGGDSPENHSAGSPNRIEWRGECVTLHFSS